MANEDDAETPEPDRSSVHVWLDQILGASDSAVRPSVNGAFRPPSRAFLHQLAFRTDFRIPDGAELTGVEIREVPEQVYAASGEIVDPGTWVFTCDHLDSVTFYADDTTGLRHTTAVVGKFMLKRGEDHRTWSEVEASRLVLVENITEVTNDSVAEPPASATITDSCVACLIDLDVNIETGDSNAHGNALVRFSGLPPGAILTSGEIDDDGGWVVHPSDLSDLSIAVPVETPSFDLELTLITDGVENAAASMCVELPAEPTDGINNSLMLRFSPPATHSPHHFRIFADGSEIFSRVIFWGGDPDVPVDLHVPLPEDDDLPFELLVREAALKNPKNQQAAILAAEFNNRPIRLDGNLVRGNVTMTPTGLAWRGDLILLARELADQSTPVEHVSLDVEAKTSEDIHPPPHDVARPDETKPEQAPVKTSNILTIKVASSDIDHPGFVEELEALQTFLHSREEGDEEVVYDRLNLTVSNWRDIDVLGPTGAKVALNPALPKLAPLGGRDNQVQTIRLNDSLDRFNDFEFIEVHGLPGACLLSHGKNLGNGSWRLTAKDACATRIVCISSSSATISKINAICTDASKTPRSENDILLGGQSRRLKSSESSSRVISVPLDQRVFDPDGHGTLSLTVGDVPAGVLLTSGNNHGDGVWTYETQANGNLGFQLMNPKGPFTVSITCVAMNDETGESTVVTQRAKVRPDRMEAMLDHAVKA